MSQTGLAKAGPSGSIFANDMKNGQRPIQSYLFTLRIWPEALGDGHTEWRGQLKYLPTGEIYYFREWSQLQELIRNWAPDFLLPS